MANLNRVLLIGNLTRDPEVRYTPKRTAVADIGIAVNRAWKDDSGETKEEVTWIDVTLFGRLAEIAQQYLAKGRQVFIEGRLSLDSWDDKQTGQKRSKLRVIAENMQLLGSKPETGPASKAGSASYQAGSASYQAVSAIASAAPNTTTGCQRSRFGRSPGTPEGTAAATGAQLIRLWRESGITAEEVAGGTR